MKNLLASLSLLLILFACSSEEVPEEFNEDQFDRKVMLTHWADNIIVPAYQQYNKELETLNATTQAFIQKPEMTELSTLRAAWLEAYKAWQWVSMFEIGKAEEVNLRNYTNIYPADTSAIGENIRALNFKLELPSKYDEQGFPALDYLLYGLREDDEQIITVYQNSESHREYLSEVVERLQTLSGEVLEHWTDSYRDTFVDASGSSASSSVNKLVNDYLFYYERMLRAGKVGIPAGVFSGSPLPHTVEGRYAKDISKVLLLEALYATQSFFNGQAFSGDTKGESLSTYLDYLNSIKDEEGLSAKINSQFNSAREAIESLNQDFADQIINDNSAFLSAYDELQKIVILMKVDMFQALNIRVDYVDADGD